MSRRIVLLFSILIGAQSNPAPKSPCKVDDLDCQKSFAGAVIALSVAGNPKLNIEKLDPLHLGKVVGDLGEVKYVLRNTTKEGYKDCIVTSSKIEFEKAIVIMNIHCPYLYMYGLYQISGKLLSIPVEGDGPYSMKIKDYDIHLKIDVEFPQGKDGQKYLFLKSTKATGDLKGEVIVDFENLFNGQKDKAENALKLVNQNQKVFVNLLEGPVLDAAFEKIIKNSNKILNDIPFNTIIQV